LLQKLSDAVKKPSCSVESSTHQSTSNLLPPLPCHQAFGYRSAKLPATQAGSRRMDVCPRSMTYSSVRISRKRIWKICAISMLPSFDAQGRNSKVYSAAIRVMAGYAALSRPLKLRTVRWAQAAPAVLASAADGGAAATAAWRRASHLSITFFSAINSPRPMKAPGGRMATRAP